MSTAAGIVAFDLDGTLLPKTTVSLHLGPWLGHHDIPQLERLFADGKITNAQIAEREAIFYKDRRRHDVWRQLGTLEFISGVAETIAWLKSRSLVPIIATVTSSLAADFVRERFGFAAASGCELAETDDGVLLGGVARHFAAEDKVTFVEKVAERFGLGLNHVVAIGDSASDIPLFHAAGFSIALNASGNARSAADAELDTQDLREVIPLIDEYLSNRPGARSAQRDDASGSAGGVSE